MSTTKMQDSVPATSPLTLINLRGRYVMIMSSYIMFGMFLFFLTLFLSHNIPLATTVFIVGYFPYIWGISYLRGRK